LRTGSIPVVAICFVPASLGLLVGVAVVQAVFGSVHAITLAFGATLLGESVDYPELPADLRERAC
jgi:predicted exporter